MVSAPMRVICRDDVIPYWVGQRPVSASKHETVELLKAMTLILGKHVDIRGPGGEETDKEFKSRMNRVMREMVNTIEEIYPHPSRFEGINVYTGGEYKEGIAELNEELVKAVWRLLQRKLYADELIAGEKK